ncbi:MAG TPA: O-antigen ligase family protein [Candidatus Binataceae bacterium]|nr:O-antigen ligase family protein [Candidatus Binataceae bacterium]
MAAIAATTALLGLLGYLLFPSSAVIAVGAVVGGVVLIKTIACTTRHPHWVLLPLVIIEALTASTVVGEQQQALGALIRYPLVALFCLPLLPRVWRSRLLWQGGFRDYSLYLLWAVLSAAYSLLPEVSLGRALSSWLPFCAVCAIVESIDDPVQARRAIGVLMLGCGLVILVNFIVLAFFPAGISWLYDPTTGIERFEGIFSQPNEIGALMLTTLAAGFACWPTLRGWARPAGAVAMVGSVVLAAMADSRGALIAVALGGASYLVWRYRIKAVLGLGVMGLGLALAAMEVPSSLNYANRGLGTFTGRNVAWSYALKSIGEHPLMGYGYEVDGQIFAQPDFQSWDMVWGEGAYSSIHDGYLSRAVGLGLPALLFWLFFMWRPALNCFYPSRDPWQLRALVLVGFLPLMLFNLTESVPDCRYFEGVLLTLVWAVMELQRLRVKNAAQPATEAPPSCAGAVWQAVRG